MSTICHISKRNGTKTIIFTPDSDNRVMVFSKRGENPWKATEHVNQAPMSTSVLDVSDMQKEMDTIWERHAK